MNDNKPDSRWIPESTIYLDGTAYYFTGKFSTRVSDGTEVAEYITESKLWLGKDGKKEIEY